MGLGLLLYCPARNFVNFESRVTCTIIGEYVMSVTRVRTKAQWDALFGKKKPVTVKPKESPYGKPVPMKAMPKKSKYGKAL